MDTECKISISKVVNLPMINVQCEENLTMSKADNPTADEKYNYVGFRIHWDYLKRNRLIFLAEVLFTILTLCFALTFLYLILTSGYFYRTEQVDQSNQYKESAIDEFLLENDEYKSDNKIIDELIYTIQLMGKHPKWKSILSQVHRDRRRRDVATTPCKQNMEHCKSIIHSIWTIANIVNDSMPHLEALLKDFSANPDESRPAVIELIKCLECKNDSITFIDVSGSEDVVDDHPLYEQSDHEQLANDINTVLNLLDDDVPNVDIKNSSADTTGHSGVKYQHESAHVSAKSIFSRQEDDSSQTTSGPGTSSSMAKTTEYESVFTDAKMINATTSATKTFKPEDATNQTNRIHDMEQTVVTANVTARVDRDNVTEIVNDSVHPSVHPSYQGHTELTEEKEKAENDSKGLRKSVTRQNTQGRIISNDRIQTKGNIDFSQTIIPTAETMKSTQQLQLTPTMSWMPHQVCFYGPQANNGPGKQSALGSVLYPASAPAVPYADSVPQQPLGFQNSGNQVPNYVQIQAQNVQFLPMQSYPGHSGLPAGLKVGPTGPGTQNFPMFPGHQTSFNGDTSASMKPPYYCTYIPVPTFQFPAIPGVSEYQRSHVSERDEIGHSDATRNASYDLRPLEYYGICPFNTIRCRDGRRCILRSQWCDGQVDCNDASDEATCSCRDRISQERFCDGYFDCPHGEDELGCLGCSKTFFSCNDWHRRYSADNCVPLSQRCDGVKQCVNGKDEMDCNILTPTYIEGKNIFTVGYTEGYLHRNFKGQWYPVSSTTVNSWAKDACVSEIGPEMKEEPEIKIHSVPDSAYQGPYLSTVGEEMKLISLSVKTAVYVQCPQLLCGTRVLSHREHLRSLVSENEGQKALWSINDKLQFRVSSVKSRIEENKTTQTDELVGSQLRVVGGRASQPKAWPFLVAIYRDGSFYCGGVILNELWILSAGHCLDGYMGHYFEIEAGLLRRLSFSPMAQSRKARYTIVHPLYDSKDMKNDIGMIMLDEPLRFNRWVRPVCLPKADILGTMWRYKPEPNSTCVAIGWGATREHGPDADHLREVEVPILENCKHDNDQNEAAICAGYPQGGRDACQGDSGGPLMCKNPYLESQWYVAGIVSHGEGCGRPDEPGTYTKVSYFLDWIQEVATGRGVPPLKRTPLEKCPGFSCEGGLGKCLPIEARCNRMVDCLDGEDELYCSGHSNYLYRQQGDQDFWSSSDLDLIVPENENFTMPQQPLKNDIELLDTTDQWFPEERNNYDDNLTTDNPDDATTDSLSDSTVPTKFTCTRLLQSISIDKRCNRVVDCEDSTDEVNCTCKDFLINLKPTAICDGYLDCDDKTDEEDCEICTENEFLCRSSKTCIPLSKKCDGHFDCEHKDDELDCFTLTNGRYVYLDADGRSPLNMQGVLTRYVNGKWRSACHRPKIHQNQSTATLIGENMCRYFGFVNLQSSESVTVKDSELETIPWNKGNAMLYETPSAASLNDEDETCPGLYIRCRPVLSGRGYTHLTGSGDYIWPWLAAIFVDGGYRCSATLLDRNWLLSSAKCIESVRLEANYTTAVLGYGPLLHYVDGPHQQVSIIDEVQSVNDSISVLLHLANQVNVTRHVRPLFLEKTVYLPGVKDVCVAVGTDENYESKSIFLRPVLENCQSCHRCFVNASIPECSENQTSDWSGTVFCRGKSGWYPAAVFQDIDGPCSFRNTQTLLGIDHINPYLTKAMNGARWSLEASCDGFRCKDGRCISQDRVCDNVPDCRDQVDEDPEYCKQIRESCENSVDGCNCMKSELRCGNGRCVDKSAFCDGNIDCIDRSDEPTLCTCAEYLKLTAPERLCDGVRHCLDKTDESPEMCPCRDTSFKCRTMSGNDTCIPQDFICDSVEDCIDGEDETECRMLRQSPDDSARSGEVIRRSYGVWHTECFSNPVTMEEESSNLCKTMGYASGTIKNDIMVTEEPTIPERDDFYVVKIHNRLWITLRNDKPLITLVKPNGTCHRAFISCV